MTGFKYDSLKNNRDALIYTCKKIAKNIDNLKGEIVFLNYDIRTGKSTSVAENIVAPLLKGKKIVVLVYSYLIVKEWKANIETACKALNVDAQIYALINPMNDTSPCKNKELLKKSPPNMILPNISKHICSICPERFNYDCIWHYTTKIKESNVTITCNQLFLQNMSLFKDADIIIFDEVPTLDLTSEIQLKELSLIRNEIQKFKIHKRHKEEFAKFLQLYTHIMEHHDEYSKFQNAQIDEQSNQNRNIPYVSLKDDLMISPDFIDYLKGKTTKSQVRYILDKLFKIFTNPICIYIAPVHKYEMRHVEVKGKKYLEIISLYSNAKLVSKNRYNIDFFFNTHSTDSKKPVVFVLSALNTKEYIEYIFGRSISDENCYGLKSINIFPNIMTTNFIHGNSYHPENKSKSFYKRNNNLSNI